MVGADDLKGQLLRAARGSVLLQLIALGATMASSVVLARALGPVAFGTYSYVFAIVSLLALPPQVGIPTLLIRETAKAQAHEDWPRLKGLWVWATRVILLTSFVVAAGVVLVLMVRSTYIGSALYWTLAAGMLLIPLIALGNARSAALQGLRLVVRGQLPEQVLRPILLIAFVWFGWWRGGALSAQWAMVWHVVAAAIAFVVGGAMLWHARPLEVSKVAADTSHARKWWLASLPLALVSGLQIVGDQAGLILLGMFRNETEVGLLKIAISASTFALFGLQIATLVFAPHIARMHALADHARLQRLASVAVLCGVVLSIPFVLLFVFWGHWLIDALYGSSYGDAYVPLLLLCAAKVVTTCFGLTAGLMAMTGHERDAARWMTVAVGIVIAFDLLLIPGFGTSGAAVAFLISTAVWNVAFYCVIRKNLRIDPSLLGVIKLGGLGSKLQS